MYQTKIQRSDSISSVVQNIILNLTTMKVMSLTQTYVFDTCVRLVKQPKALGVAMVRNLYSPSVVILWPCNQIRKNLF